MKKFPLNWMPSKHHEIEAHLSSIAGRDHDGVVGDGLDEEGLRHSPVVEQRNHVENSTDDRTVRTLGKSEASGVGQNGGLLPNL